MSSWLAVRLLLTVEHARQRFTDDASTVGVNTDKDLIWTDVATPNPPNICPVVA